MQSGSSGFANGKSLPSAGPTESASGLSGLAAAMSAAGQDAEGDDGVTFNTAQAFADLGALFSSPPPQAGAAAKLSDSNKAAADLDSRAAGRKGLSVIMDAPRDRSGSTDSEGADEACLAAAFGSPAPTASALGRVAVTVCADDSADSEEEDSLQEPQPTSRLGAALATDPSGKHQAALGVLNATIASLDSSVASSTGIAEFGSEYHGGAPAFGQAASALNISAVPRALSPGAGPLGSGVAPAASGLSFAIFEDADSPAPRQTPGQVLQPSPRHRTGTSGTGSIPVAYEQPTWLGAASPEQEDVV